MYLAATFIVYISKLTPLYIYRLLIFVDNPAVKLIELLILDDNFINIFYLEVNLIFF